MRESTWKHQKAQILARGRAPNFTIFGTGESTEKHDLEHDFLHEGKHRKARFCARRKTFKTTLAPNTFFFDCYSFWDGRKLSHLFLQHICEQISDYNVYCKGCSKARDKETHMIEKGFFHECYWNTTGLLQAQQEVVLCWQPHGSKGEGEMNRPIDYYEDEDKRINKGLKKSKTTVLIFSVYHTRCSWKT